MGHPGKRGEVRNPHTQIHMHGEKQEGRASVKVPEFCLEDRALNTTTCQESCREETLRAHIGSVWRVCVFMFAQPNVYSTERKKDKKKDFETTLVLLRTDD